MIKKSKLGVSQGKVLEKANDRGRIQDIVGQGLKMDDAFAEMNQIMNNYEDVKRSCQVKREEYVRHAERGALEIRRTLENQIDILSEFLDISSLKQVKEVNEEQ